ncbi:unnamed protein product [Pseudo-nitzschia multistriata]|uniref:Uncharacterized protein n=1 Tax=Pseudo-nitzschia multistriata TaxID=183589 RepID=A0A448Z6S5_9STRA|nr:unnamed protein product [Pseudo-nitzschia multistriata]
MRLLVKFLFCVASVAVVAGATVDNRSLQEDSTSAPKPDDLEPATESPTKNSGDDQTPESLFGDLQDGTKSPSDEKGIDSPKESSGGFAGGFDGIGTESPKEGSGGFAGGFDGIGTEDPKEGEETPVPMPDDFSPILPPMISEGNDTQSPNKEESTRSPSENEGTQSPKSGSKGDEKGFGGIEKEEDETSAPKANDQDEPAEASGMGFGQSPVPKPSKKPTGARSSRAPVASPVAAPTDKNKPPTYSDEYKQPSLRPATAPSRLPYVSKGDDPLPTASDDLFGEWFTNDSTIEEMEHDKNVIIALSSTFAVMFFFAVFVAYQTLNNPNGICASICRITVACWCGILRCICYPCRAVCGCTGEPTQKYNIPEDGGFSNDLELS